MKLLKIEENRQLLHLRNAMKNGSYKKLVNACHKGKKTHQEKNYLDLDHKKRRIISRHGSPLSEMKKKGKAAPGTGVAYGKITTSRSHSNNFLYSTKKNWKGKTCSQTPVLLPSPRLLDFILLEYRGV